MGPSSGAAHTMAFGLVEVIVILIAVAILLFLLVPAIIIPVTSAPRAQCAYNLSQIGKAMQVYAMGHQHLWPDVFTEESTRWDDVGNTRTDEWNPVTNKGKPPEAEPGDNGTAVQSNTANLWLLIVSANLSPAVFVCPRSAHQFDEMDEGYYETVRDFRGETFVSYSFQNVLGDYRLKSTSGRASSLAVAADANPMRRDFRTSGIGEKKREGVTDRELARKPQFLGQEEYIAAWNQETDSVAGSWELNSPNHEFKGQNVLYLDGHVEWKTHPYCGPNWDNIWLARKPGDDWGVEKEKIGTLWHYNDPASYNGRFTLPADSTGDSFLVP